MCSHGHILWSWSFLKSPVPALFSCEQAVIVAVAMSARGLVLYEISVDMRAVKAMEGLTLEGAIARLPTASEPAPPVPGVCA